MSTTQDERAKGYQRTKQKLTLIGLFLSPFLLAVIGFSPVSGLIKGLALSWTTNAVIGVGFYFTLFSVLMSALDFPLSFYSGYILERKYELSNHTFRSWFQDYLKKALLGFTVAMILIQLLYLLIRFYPGTWWIYAWLGYAGVSYLLGKIFPIFIVPLFYKYSDVGDKELKAKIYALAEKVKMPVGNIFSINLSRTTKKANAAFMGMGKTKRVVLSDTLLDQFNHGEIETVMAHELGHYCHKDIWKQLGLGLISSFVAFWLAFQLLAPLAVACGYEDGAKDIAALPLLFLVFYAFSVLLMPLQNGFSRWMERRADDFALDLSPNLDNFVSCMEKLGRINLAAASPNPVYEWFFYDHPSIKKRIQRARERLR